jgi:hypothetical protein
MSGDTPPRDRSHGSGLSTTTTSLTTAASQVVAADKCRWDTLHFPKCNFKLDEFASWLDTVRTHLYTRKASFLLRGRITGDDHLQEMCLLADCMTKALTPDKHLTACKLLGVAQGGVRAA